MLVLTEPLELAPQIVESARKQVCIIMNKAVRLTGGKHNAPKPLFRAPAEREHPVRQGSGRGRRYEQR